MNEKGLIIEHFINFALTFFKIESGGMGEWLKPPVC
jgi:hypothetical protein